MLKTEIQERVKTAHQELVSALDDVPDEQTTCVGLTSHWSVKDALAHIAAWEIEGARIVSEIQSGTWKPQRLDKQMIDDFNARVVEERRALSMIEQRAEFDLAHERMSDVIETLPNQVDEKSPTYKFVEGVTFRHHSHHAEQIRQFNENCRATNEK
jgi:hypothetical protein